VPGQIHGYDALVWRKPARDKWRRVHDFLRPLMAPGADRLKETASRVKAGA
jgi:hypothetical protein